jgi:hypothetical protein
MSADIWQEKGEIDKTAQIPMAEFEWRNGRSLGRPFNPKSISQSPRTS